MFVSRQKSEVENVAHQLGQIALNATSQPRQISSPIKRSLLAQELAKFQGGSAGDTIEGVNQLSEEAVERQLAGLGLVVEVATVASPTREAYVMVEAGVAEAQFGEEFQT